MRRFIRRGRSPQLTHKEHHLSRALFSSTFPSICRLLPVPSNAKKALTIIGTFSIWIDGVNFTLRVVDLSTALFFFFSLLHRTVEYPDRNGSPKYIFHKWIFSNYLNMRLQESSGIVVYKMYFEIKYLAFNIFIIEHLVTLLLFSHCFYRFVITLLQWLLTKTINLRAQL